MTKKIRINVIEGTITISKAFYKKASNYGTAEYKELRNVMSENPTFKIVFKTIDKKSYNGLTFERMAEYINTQPNSEANMKEFEAVMKVAEAKGSKYPLTKKWFLATFPEYKLNEVSDKETGTSLNNSEDKTNNVEEKTNINEEKAA